MSPYTQSVVDATQNQFNNQNARQQAGLTSNAISQGALGGNRVGVAQGVLAGQQQLAQAPVIAGLYNQGYGQAVNTAQGQQQAGLAGAYGLSSIGTALQNAGLSGANAQIGAGTLQQQTQQAQDQARYQQFMQQQAYPFQTTQWLAGIGTGVGSQLGTNTTGTTTAPAPNPLTQLLGLGISGAGLAGGLGWKPFVWTGGAIHKDGGGGVGGFPYGMSGAPYAGGPSWIPGVNISPHALPASHAPAAAGVAGGDASKMIAQAIQMAGRGGGDATMGSPGVGSPLTMFGAAGDYGVPTFMARGGGVHGFAYGGTPMDVMNGDLGWASPDVGPGYGTVPFDERAASIRQAIANGDFDPRGANSTEFAGTPGMAASNAGMVPIPQPRPASAPMADDDEAIPAASTPTAGVAGAGMAIPGSGAAMPYARDDARAGFGASVDEGSYGSGKLSKHLPNALLTAGLGMLASRSPFLGVGVGEGGLAGMGAFSAAQAAEQAQADKRTTQAQTERRIAMEAERIAQSASQFAKTNALATRAQDEKGQLTDYQKSQVEHQKKLEDPEFVKQMSDAKSGSGLTGPALDIKARQMVNGDYSGLTNIGRGAQAGKTLEKISNRAAEILSDEGGMSSAEAASHMSKKLQEFKASGIYKNAEARTAAGREANLNLILNATEAAIPAALEASESVSRTGWVPLNKIIQNGQVIASSPELKRFGMANLQLAEHWARAMNPLGVMRESDRDMALHFLNTADSKETYRQAVDQLHKQILRERDAVRKGSSSASPNAPPTPGSGGESGGRTVPSGGAPETRILNGVTYIKTGPNPSDWARQ